GRGMNRLSKIECLLCLGRINDITRSKTHLSAVSFGFSTADWLSVIGDQPQLREGLVQRDRLVIFGGGLPIRVDGELVGAIGVSGASETEDEACARAGIEAIGLSA
ncbi:MAG: heme-binding protein, partial [Candidatus Thiodiazotropha sp. (ex Ustalcina ferruginea)]|nr:heme-binding protein [Candidatus Thiodiazotropha sp. (ex Ustalcina ferruginea)]